MTDITICEHYGDLLFSATNGSSALGQQGNEPARHAGDCMQSRFHSYATDFQAAMICAMQELQNTGDPLSQVPAWVS